MFTHFSIGGLTIANLQAQVLGILGNPFVVACLLAVLASPFIVRIVRTIKLIMFGGYAQALESHFGQGDDEYGSGETWHEKLYRRGLGSE